MRFSLIILLFSAYFNGYSQGYADKIKLLGQQGVPFFYNEDIEANIEKWKLNVEQNTSDILGRSVLWYSEMEVAQKTNRLPWFIKFIPAANTGFDNAYTGADGSKGMWPLNYSIAKKYGLKLNSYVDERRSIVTSADAACRYLADLQYIYKDWLKTITAFRIGAIRLNQVIRLAGNSLEFEDIYKYLEPEEREPIIQFYAAVTVMYFRHDFNIQETVFDKPDSDTATTIVGLKYALIEQYTGISALELRALNPQYTMDMVPWFGGVTTFNIPLSKGPLYQKYRDSMVKTLKVKPPVMQPISMDTVVEVRDGITYITTKQKEENSADTNTQMDTTSHIWVWYTVKTGDGFYTLSDIFDCSIEEMKVWNDIQSNTLIANSLLKFYVTAERAEHYKKLTTLNHLQKREIALSD